MIGFCFDEMMSRLVAEALRKRGYRVIMASDVNMIDKDDDSDHLPYATREGLVLVTLDRPFAGRTQARTDHAGLICLTGKQNDFGEQLNALIAFAEEKSGQAVNGRVFWLK